MDDQIQFLVFGIKRKKIGQYPPPDGAVVVGGTVVVEGAVVVVGGAVVVVTVVGVPLTVTVTLAIASGITGV